ncbi:MAG: hypothetical protein JRN29_03630 [Nitrososphaerota archaeon]|nr:hypothetical protein [Nitrososphaerota archaeon]
MEDDHSRKGWAMRQRDDTVVKGMEALHPAAYENLLTDNGSQFSRMNSTMRRYCESSITGRHVWSSIHHPQTPVQLPEGAEEVPDAQAREEQGREGGGRLHRGLPSLVQSRQDGVHDRTEQRYSGGRDPEWYRKLVAALKLESVLPLSCADGG